MVVFYNFFFNETLKAWFGRFPPDCEKGLSRLLHLESDFILSLCFQILPLDTDIRAAYAKGTDDEQKFIQNLALFLATYLKEHSSLVEKSADLRQHLMDTLRYVLLISVVDETEIFKICLELWYTLASDLYLQNPTNTYQSQLFPSSLMKPLNVESQTQQNRRKFYEGVLSEVRVKRAQTGVFCLNSIS